MSSWPRFSSFPPAGGSARRRTFLIPLFTFFIFHLSSFHFLGSKYQLHEKYNVAVQNITSSIKHDGLHLSRFRIYAYTTLTSYTTYQCANKQEQLLIQALDGFSELPAPPKNISADCAAVLALYFTASKLVNDPYSLLTIAEKKKDAFAQAIGSEKFAVSIQYAEQIGDLILYRAAYDGYDSTRTLPRYFASGTAGSWQPTPPDMADAVEPYWGMIHPFMQVNIPDSLLHIPEYSTDSSSAFFQQAKEVYKGSMQLTEEQKNIANFWDDNPYTVVSSGHFMYGVKKVSPPGHWLDITRIAIETKNTSLEKAALSYCLVSAAMFDAVICCWQTKYASDVLRPVTYINMYMDEHWSPYIATPPFPEYTSAHSATSGAASTVLTSLFGEHFAFTDSLETAFDLPARHFSAFSEAAEEAAMSRVYGGIHYPVSAEDGLAQGRYVGKQMARLRSDF
ncbi:MAG: vanadium-dependent haloperoxidase [Chitinophagales bacterium]